MPERPVRAADCGCCAGLEGETPRQITNLRAQAAVSYRVGTHHEFKDSLLARLSGAVYPALGPLTTRADDDFTIALCDALATMLDVLTFYQERLANEHYLCTATETRSVAAMARLIGYVPSPGVAASTHLTFTLLEAPGAPSQSAEPVTIPKGTKVQSVPGPNEKPQVFETVEDAKARVDWNSVPAQLTESWQPHFGDTDLYLEGVATRLQPGDAILIVGAERERIETNNNWDVRVLAGVEADIVNNRTRVTWTDRLGHVDPHVEPAAEAVQVFALRQRAALFGHNAPDPNLMSARDSNLADLIETDRAHHERIRWKDYCISAGLIDLDAAYPKITAGSWIVLVSNQESEGSASLPGYIELYRAKAVRQESLTGFGLSGTVTRVQADTPENLTAARFGIRDTLALAQSEALPTAARALVHPVYGDRLALDRRVEGLAPNQVVAISGKRQRIAIARGVNSLKLTCDDGKTVALTEGDSLILLAGPQQRGPTASEYLDPDAFRRQLARPETRLRLKASDRDGRIGTFECAISDIVLEASRKNDPTVTEIAAIGSGSDAIVPDRDRTTLTLAFPLAHCYERASVRLSANVVRATHGETVKEILGSSDAGRPDQTLALRQSPLTYVSADTSSGRASTVELRVNDLLWTEAATLYGHGGDERRYAVATDDEGAATVRFGDGVEGARPPSGQNNVRCTYRKGLGAAGNVAADELTNLLTRPLGVSSVTNPEAASGGEDRETLEAARENAPLTVLTLDRAVSIQDYADFARAFAGIAKAHALWIPAGPVRGVFLTVAGVGGGDVSETSDTFRNLLTALRKYGDPLTPIHLVDRRRAVFRLRLAVRVAADREGPRVLRDVGEALRTTFGFDRRALGQGVSVDEVMAAAQDVPGVDAAQVTQLYRPTPGVEPSVQPRLFAALPVVSMTETPLGAELLTLDADALKVEEMP